MKWMDLTRIIKITCLIFIISNIALAETTSLKLLGDAPQFDTLPKFTKILKYTSDKNAYEWAKIEYLLDRLSHSVFQFRRNGSLYTSKQAVMHLKWKCWKHKKEILTAQDFIEKIASGSRASGEDYGICRDHLDCWSVRPVWRDELELLDRELLDRMTPRLEPIKKNKN